MNSILWFRKDLRITDNPALSYAVKLGKILPVFIFDPQTDQMGGASRWWLHHSLEALHKSLGQLHFFSGDPQVILSRLGEELDISSLVWNRCYEPDVIARDKKIKSSLQAEGWQVQSFNSNLLFEPWEIKNKTGGPFKVYSPFWRAMKQLDWPDVIQSTEIEHLKPSVDLKDEISLQELSLLPTKPDWAEGWADFWQPGEVGAHNRLSDFIKKDLKNYKKDRDRPDLNVTSLLSSHLHFGEISPRQIISKVEISSVTNPALVDGEKFFSEIAWREFAYHLLYHFPTLTNKNWKPAFDHYPWAESKDQLKAWQKGQTGYPFVDAGMRELWSTGFMHNRVRMVVASFLIKHLRIHWREGMDWFRDTLVDADLANNAASWQWVAGSGADAAPYFRIFNPITQGTKFDPEGRYVRKWCPELANLPTKNIHAPFEASAEILAKAGVKLGETYPLPIVDHKEAREAALAGYDVVKASQAN